jgi:hypothetical protein
VKAFAKNIAPDSSEGFMLDFLLTLSYSLNTGNPVKYDQAVKSDIKQVVLQYMNESISEPLPQQEALFIKVSTILKEKNQSPDCKLPPILMARGIEERSIQQIEQAVKNVLLDQNVKASPQQIADLTQECSKYLNAHNAVQHILENYVPGENRPAVITDNEGDEHEIESVAHGTIVTLDREVLALDQEIVAAKEQKKSQLNQLEQLQSSINEEYNVNKKEFRVLKGEKKACNKLLSGLQKVPDVFAAQQVAIADKGPESFLDNHFDLGRIIREEIATSATLVFMPPEFYAVELDLNKQELRMNGLNQDETPALDSLNKTVRTVKQCAGNVQKREHLIDGCPQDNLSQLESNAEDKREQIALTKSKNTMWTKVQGERGSLVADKKNIGNYH